MTTEHGTRTAAPDDLKMMTVLSRYDTYGGTYGNQVLRGQSTDPTELLMFGPDDGTDGPTLAARVRGGYWAERVVTFGALLLTYMSQLSS